MKNDAEKFWCIIPAAGVGKRMLAECPKQYLLFQGSTILDVTIGRLLSCHNIEKIVVCIHADDENWQHSLYYENDRVVMSIGGAERADTVLKGIETLNSNASDGDWVLVHDAARPCVKLTDIQALINVAIEKKQGAILAAPIHDTVKEVVGGVVQKTLERTVLWRALTPQLFKINQLQSALISAKNQGVLITDEASAIEHINEPVLVVEGSADNIKITLPKDLELADFYINKQEEEICA